MQRHAATPLEVQNFDGVLDGLFHGLVAVFVHIGLALGPVGDAACAADAAAFAGHTLDKVVGQHILVGTPFSCKAEYIWMPSGSQQR